MTIRVAIRQKDKYLSTKKSRQILALSFLFIKQEKGESVMTVKERLAKIEKALAAIEKKLKQLARK